MSVMRSVIRLVLGGLWAVGDKRKCRMIYCEFAPCNNLVNNEAGEPYSYTGEWWVGYINLLHLRARWYSPETGIFLSRDVWGGDERRPLSMNGWSYVEGNPIVFVDPSGRCRGLTGRAFEVCSAAAIATLDAIGWWEKNVNRNLYKGTAYAIIGEFTGFVTVERFVRDGCTRFVREGVPTTIGYTILDLSGGGDITLVGKDISGGQTLAVNWYSMEAGSIYYYNDSFVPLTTPTGINGGGSQQILFGLGGTNLEAFGGRDYIYSAEVGADAILEASWVGEIGFSLKDQGENYPKFPDYQGHFAKLPDDIQFDDVSRAPIMTVSTGLEAGANAIPNGVEGRLSFSPGTNQAVVYRVSGPELIDWAIGDFLQRLLRGAYLTIDDGE